MNPSFQKEFATPFNPNRFHNLHFAFFNPEWIKLVYDISHYCYPNEAKKRYKLFFRSLFWSKLTGLWYQKLANSELLSTLVQQERLVATKLHRHILRLDNPIEKRIRILLEHYTIAEQLLDPELYQQILINDGLLVSQLEISPDHIFDLLLGYGGYPGKEGELAFYWQQRGTNSYLARVSFTILQKENSLSLYIGGIQGAHGKNSREKVGEASKLCSGLSPMRAVMEAIFAFAKLIDATEILAVADEQQISQKKSTKHFSYNSFWQELGGACKLDNDYSLPLQPKRKDIFDAPTKRRAKYRRQHAHLDAIFQDTLNVLSPKVKNQHPGKE